MNMDICAHLIPIGMACGDCEAYQERAAIMEYDGGLGRVEAEKMALTMGGRVPFQMHPKWSPSGHIGGLCLRAGLVIPHDEMKIALAEHISYWMSRPMMRTQSQWDNTFVKHLIHSKITTSEKESVRNEQQSVVNRLTGRSTTLVI